MPPNDRTAMARILAYVDQTIAEKHEVLSDPDSDQEPEARQKITEEIKKTLRVRAMIEDELKRLDNQE